MLDVACKCGKTFLVLAIIRHAALSFWAGDASDNSMSARLPPHKSSKVHLPTLQSKIDDLKAGTYVSGMLPWASPQIITKVRQRG